MGWAHCGINSITGKEMGYGVKGVCSHPECKQIIDHGLSYVCGGMHEGGEHGCGDYFCSKHLKYHGCDVRSCWLCEKCFNELKEPNVRTN